MSGVQIKPWTTVSCCLSNSSGGPSHANQNPCSDYSSPRSNLPIPCLCPCLSPRFLSRGWCQHRTERVQKPLQRTQPMPVRNEGRRSLLTTPFPPRPLVSLASSLDLLDTVHEERLLIPRLWDLKLCSLSGVPGMLQTPFEMWFCSHVLSVVVVSLSRGRAA